MIILWVFSHRIICKFINHSALISSKKGKYPFVIANTDSSEKGWTHWWRILNIEPKKTRTKITDSKITLCKIQFNLNAYKNLSRKELDALSDTANDFFYFILAFGSKHKLCNFVNIWMVEDRVQNLNSVTCGIFQVYFYDNLFNPNKTSKIQDKAKLNKRTIEILLNELFALDD